MWNFGRRGRAPLIQKCRACLPEIWKTFAVVLHCSSDQLIFYANKLFNLVHSHVEMFINIIFGEFVFLLNLRMFGNCHDFGSLSVCESHILNINKPWNINVPRCLNRFDSNGRVFLFTRGLKVWIFETLEP